VSQTEQPKRENTSARANQMEKVEGILGDISNSNRNYRRINQDKHHAEEREQADRQQGLLESSAKTATAGGGYHETRVPLRKSRAHFSRITSRTEGAKPEGGRFDTKPAKNKKENKGALSRWKGLVGLRLQDRCEYP